VIDCINHCACACVCACVCVCMCVCTCVPAQSHGTLQPHDCKFSWQEVSCCSCCIFICISLIMSEARHLVLLNQRFAFLLLIFFVSLLTSKGCQPLTVLTRCLLCFILTILATCKLNIFKSSNVPTVFSRRRMCLVSYC